MYMLIAATLFAQYPKVTRMNYIKSIIMQYRHSRLTSQRQLSGARTPIRQFASCVLVDVDDTLNSIFNSDSAIGYYVSQRAERQDQCSSLAR